MEGESGNTTHLTQVNPRQQEPLDGRMAPSTAHNGALWLLPIMNPTGGTWLLGDSTPLNSCEASRCHLLPTKNGSCTLQYKNSLKKEVVCNPIHFTFWCCPWLSRHHHKLSGGFLSRWIGCVLQAIPFQAWRTCLQISKPVLDKKSQVKIQSIEEHHTIYGK